MAGNKFMIINTQTGEKKETRDNLFNSLYQKGKHKGKWKKLDDVRKGALEEIPIQTKIAEIPTISYDQQIQALKGRIEILESKLTDCCKEGTDCCKNMPEKTDESIVKQPVPIQVNPFDIIEPSMLKDWLIENSIPFPKTVKKLETLQNHIPEIYKN